LHLTYLEQPNRARRALPGLLGGPTLGVSMVLTGPSARCSALIPSQHFLALPKSSTPRLFLGADHAWDTVFQKIGAVTTPARPGPRGLDDA